MLFSLMSALNNLTMHQKLNIKLKHDITSRHHITLMMLCTCLDLDTVQFGGKLVIDCKHMAIFYLLGLWLLGENSLSGLPTGQRLQRPH